MSGRKGKTIEHISWSISKKELPDPAGSEPPIWSPVGCTSDWATEAAFLEGRHKQFNRVFSPESVTILLKYWSLIKKILTENLKNLIVFNIFISYPSSNNNTIFIDINLWIRMKAEDYLVLFILIHRSAKIIFLIPQFHPLTVCKLFSFSYTMFTLQFPTLIILPAWHR